MCDHVLRLIDIAKINNDRARHRALQAIQIQCAELFPLGHDYQCVGALCDLGVAVELSLAGSRLILACAAQTGYADREPTCLGKDLSYRRECHVEQFRIGARNVLSVGRVQLGPMLRRERYVGEHARVRSALLYCATPSLGKRPIASISNA